MSVDGWTVEKALQTGLTMETGAYQLYMEMADKVKNPGSKQLLKELAADEAKHRDYFAKALKDPEKVMDPSKVNDIKKVLVDLGVTDPLKSNQIDQDAAYQDVLIFAAKSEKTAYEFYSALAKNYSAHPLGKMWAEFAQMELGHKQKLEAEYDDVVLGDN